jgi:hypothetical protein
VARYTSPQLLDQPWPGTACNIGSDLELVLHLRVLQERARCPKLTKDRSITFAAAVVYCPSRPLLGPPACGVPESHGLHYIRVPWDTNGITMLVPLSDLVFAQHTQPEQARERVPAVHS